MQLFWKITSKVMCASSNIPTKNEIFLFSLNFLFPSQNHSPWTYNKMMCVILSATVHRVIVFIDNIHGRITINILTHELVNYRNMSVSCLQSIYQFTVT